MTNQDRWPIFEGLASANPRGSLQISGRNVREDDETGSVLDIHFHWDEVDGDQSETRMEGVTIPHIPSLLDPATNGMYRRDGNCTVEYRSEDPGLLEEPMYILDVDPEDAPALKVSGIRRRDYPRGYTGAEPLLEEMRETGVYSAAKFETELLEQFRDEPTAITGENIGQYGWFDGTLTVDDGQAYLEREDRSVGVGLDGELLEQYQGEPFRVYGGLFPGEQVEGMDAGFAIVGVLSYHLVSDDV